MIRTLFPLILAGLVFAAGLGSADEGDLPKKDNNPDTPRLKRKKRDKAPEVKPADKDDRKDKEKAKEEDEKIVPEDGPPGDPEEDDQEVLERVSRNMRAVEEKLGNREVGEPTQQQQRDVLKDLDSLIRRSQQQEQGGGGGADQQPQGGADEKDNQEKQGGAKQRQQRAGQGKQGQQRAQRQPRQGRGQGKDRMMAKNQGQGGEQPKQGKPGIANPGQGGAAGDSQRRDNDPQDGKLYKDVWGHLPESLRAEMNAYSNPRPFMPRYDDLIKKYYRTIAEQGRKKGD